MATTKDHHPTKWSAIISDMMARHGLGAERWAKAVRAAGFSITPNAIYSLLDGTTKEPNSVTIYTLFTAIGEDIKQVYPHYNPQRTEHRLGLHMLYRQARLGLSPSAMAVLLDTNLTTYNRLVGFGQVPSNLYKNARFLARMPDSEIIEAAIAAGFTPRERDQEAATALVPPPEIERAEPEPDADDWRHVAPDKPVPSPAPAVRIELPDEQTVGEVLGITDHEVYAEHTLPDVPGATLITRNGDVIGVLPTPPALTSLSPKTTPPPVMDEYATAVWSIVQGLGMILRLPDITDKQGQLLLDLSSALEASAADIKTPRASGQMALLEIITDPTTMTVEKFPRIIRGLRDTMKIRSGPPVDRLTGELASAVQSSLELLPEDGNEQAD